MNQERDSLQGIEKELADWRDGLMRRGLLSAEREELEDHLLSLIEELQGESLSAEEALIIALGRIGNSGGIASSFSRLHAGRIWKQLTRSSRGPGGPRNAFVITLLFVTELIASQIPRIINLPFSPQQPAAYAVYIFFLMYTALAFYFIRSREIPLKQALLYCLLLFAVILTAGLYALEGGEVIEGSATITLLVIHLPLLLWLLLLPLYLGIEEVLKPQRSLDFIRFTGETFIYAVLIGCGVFVSMVASLALFSMIGIDLEDTLTGFLITGIIPLIPFAAALLVEAKGHLIENFAPILARIFLPLFLLIMGIFLVTSWITGNPMGENRDLLLLMELLLALVLAMMLYSASIDRREESRGAWDILIAVSAAAAVIIGSEALKSVAHRFSIYGISPNRIAVVGENILLLTNLAALLFLFILLLAGKIRRSMIYRVQALFLIAYGLWFLVPILVLPPVFGFQ